MPAKPFVFGTFGAPAVGSNGLLTNLISYWKLDEASGSATDAHGSNTLTDSSGTTGTGTGKINGARDFEKDNSDGFNITSNSTLNVGTGDFSFSLWVKLESASAFVGNWVLCKDVAYGLMYFNPTDGWRVYIDGSSYAANDTTAEDTAWHHLAVIRAGSNIKLYQDNVKILDTTASAATLDNAFDFTVGQANGGGQHWDGLIDEMGFWKRALAAGDVAALYNSGSGLAYASFS